jgi:hypothetical protein
MEGIKGRQQFVNLRAILEGTFLKEESHIETEGYIQSLDVAPRSYMGTLAEYPVSRNKRLAVGSLAFNGPHLLAHPGSDFRWTKENACLLNFGHQHGLSVRLRGLLKRRDEHRYELNVYAIAIQSERYRNYDNS